MDERRIKRLIVMLVMAIVVIMFFKYLLTKAVTNLGNAQQARKRAVVLHQVPLVPAVPASAVPDMAAGNTVDDAGNAVSSPGTSN